MTDIIKWLKDRLAQSSEKASPFGLPALLHPYVDEIEATRLPIIGADVRAGMPRHRDGSQLGGQPWWPKGRKLPTDKNGKPLFLLVQINCAELPYLDPLPRRGLLQFFIGCDDLYGANFDNLLSSTGFACIFHESTDGPCKTAFDELILAEDDLLPLEEPLRARALALSNSSMTADGEDYRFAKLLPALNAAMIEDDALFDAYSDWSAAAPIRLGGYPSFTQDDPRGYSDGRNLGDFNLLTVDTTTGIMWGDVGVAQFFIQEEDLRRGDFSKVAYNWDCH